MHLADAFIQIDLQSINFFVSMCSLGIEPTTISAANPMLKHRVTGTFQDKPRIKCTVMISFKAVF